MAGYICCDFGNGVHKCESGKKCHSFQEKKKKEGKDITSKLHQSIVR